MAEDQAAVPRTAIFHISLQKQLLYLLDASWQGISNEYSRLNAFSSVVYFSSFFILLRINPNPAEPGYALPLQAV